MDKIKAFFKKLIAKIKGFFKDDDTPPPPPPSDKTIDQRVDEAVRDLPGGNGTVGVDKDGRLVFK